MDNKEMLPTQAVAVSYNRTRDCAPRVVAKGAGYVANKILATAKEHQVPVYKNQTLLNALMAVDIQQEIPPALYQAVAETLALVYRLDQDMGTGQTAR
jgi:flagellar biosynthesis protein